MFSKAPIKRYNDEVNETPAPGDYDPKEAKSRGSKIAHSTSARFNEVSKSVTPGKFLSFKHSMATANLNKREELVTNTTTVSKYIHKKPRICININLPFRTVFYEVNFTSQQSHLGVLSFTN